MVLQAGCRPLRGGRTRLMTNIVVLIKQVPDTWSERKLTDGDFTLDREAADATRRAGACGHQDGVVIAKPLVVDIVSAID